MEPTAIWEVQAASRLRALLRKAVSLREYTDDYWQEKVMMMQISLAIPVVCYLVLMDKETHIQQNGFWNSTR
jgi:hypothetical protein